MESLDLICVALWVVGLFLFRMAYRGNQAYELVATQSQDFLNSSYDMLETGEIDDESEESKFLSAFSNSMLKSTVLFFSQLGLSIYIMMSVDKGMIFYLAVASLYILSISFGLSYTYKRASGEVNIFKLVKNFPKSLRVYDRVSQFVSGLIFLAIAVLFFIQ